MKTLLLLILFSSLFTSLFVSCEEQTDIGDMFLLPLSDSFTSSAIIGSIDGLTCVADLIPNLPKSFDVEAIKAFALDAKTCLDGSVLLSSIALIPLYLVVPIFLSLLCCPCFFCCGFCRCCCSCCKVKTVEKIPGSCKTKTCLTFQLIAILIGFIGVALGVMAFLTPSATIDRVYTVADQYYSTANYTIDYAINMLDTLGDLAREVASDVVTESLPVFTDTVNEVVDIVSPAFDNYEEQGQTFVDALVAILTELPDLVDGLDSLTSVDNVSTIPIVGPILSAALDSIPADFDLSILSNITEALNSTGVDLTTTSTFPELIAVLMDTVTGILDSSISTILESQMASLDDTIAEFVPEIRSTLVNISITVYDLYNQLDTNYSPSNLAGAALGMEGYTSDLITDPIFDIASLPIAVPDGILDFVVNNVTWLPFMLIAFVIFLLPCCFFFCPLYCTSCCRANCCGSCCTCCCPLLCSCTPIIFAVIALAFTAIGMVTNLAVCPVMDAALNTPFASIAPFVDASADIVTALGDFDIDVPTFSTDDLQEKLDTAVSKANDMVSTSLSDALNQTTPIDIDLNDYLDLPIPSLDFPGLTWMDVRSVGATLKLFDTFITLYHLGELNLDGLLSCPTPEAIPWTLGLRRPVGLVPKAGQLVSVEALDQFFESNIIDIVAGFALDMFSGPNGTLAQEDIDLINSYIPAVTSLESLITTISPLTSGMISAVIASKLDFTSVIDDIESSLSAFSSLSFDSDMLSGLIDLDGVVATYGLSLSVAFNEICDINSDNPGVFTDLVSFCTAWGQDSDTTPQRTAVEAVLWCEDHPDDVAQVDVILAAGVPGIPEITFPSDIPDLETVSDLADLLVNFYNNSDTVDDLIALLSTLLSVVNAVTSNLGDIIDFLNVAVNVETGLLGDMSTLIAENLYQVLVGVLGLVGDLSQTVGGVALGTVDGILNDVMNCTLTAMMTDTITGLTCNGIFKFFDFMMVGTCAMWLGLFCLMPALCCTHPIMRGYKVQKTADKKKGKKKSKSKKLEEDDEDTISDDSAPQPAIAMGNPSPQFIMGAPVQMMPQRVYQVQYR
eukprot:gnl/Dysnectes_brevis/964_a1074_4500.p1 GENE.gnl/Dysnectes_brevis/964_a1074_4500~~gnl/Dysnectes_brevis/964_a1074_4500.p1  ORF type:complete len:1072 (+),score=426.40 gnl/Dysnectes_brevis/964_a1074_4500:73-3288(+)